MAGTEEDQIRYVVHFAEGGAGRRRYHDPLQESGRLIEGTDEYVVLRVEQPKSPGALGYAWVELAS